MKFCSKCGKEIMDDAVICVHCGCATADYPRSTNTKSDYEDALDRLENNSRSATTFWKTFGIIQMLIGGVGTIIFIVTWINWNYDSLALFPLVSFWLVLCCGIGNLQYGRKEARFMESIKQKPVGIIKHYEPLGNLVATLIANILFGFLFGIIGSVLDIITRNHVMNNRRIFKEIEQQNAEFILRNTFGTRSI